MSIEEIIKNIMLPNKMEAIVWAWSDCPLEEKWSLGHGGDEDEVVLYNKHNYRMGTMVEKLAVCDHNEMEIGETHMLAVTAHS